MKPGDRVRNIMFYKKPWPRNGTIGIIQSVGMNYINLKYPGDERLFCDLRINFAKVNLFIDYYQALNPIII